MESPSATAEVGILTYPSVQLGTVHGLTDILVMASHFARSRMAEPLTIRVTHWQWDEDGEMVCVYDTMPGEAPKPQFIVIPLTLTSLPPPETLSGIVAWLQLLHAGGATLGSICSGAFILAETGLLEGRLASTHWACADALQDRFPAIRVNSQIRIVDHGDVITVGGFMAWVDMGLRLVERLLGPAMAAETARLLDRPAIDAPTYFQGFSPKLGHGDEAILRAQNLIHASDGRDVSLDAIAGEARLERRTLLRRFANATGMTPIEYSRNVRMARARELLEFSNKPLKDLAFQVGYEDPNAFTRAFRRTIGMSPADYRRQFGQGRRSFGAAPDVQPA